MQSFDILQQALDKLDIIAEYIDEAYFNNILSDNTYLRVTSGIQLLRYNLINSNTNTPEDIYEISLPNLIEIINKANDIEIDKANQPVYMYIKQEEQILKNILKEFYNQDELTPNLVDKLLTSINELDKKINN
ncbi:MAG: hypothetical protein IJW59_00840 [Clostridia bacterium]|nr:hypothetical protein [Clostridia bacterium]